MEELLNKLIEKGWKPFGIEWIVKVDMSREHYWIDFENSKWYALASEISPRSLASKESWLWQFVCENGLNNTALGLRSFWVKKWYKYLDYQYRLIESSLKDENELEDFLLSNIKVDD